MSTRSFTFTGTEAQMKRIIARLEVIRRQREDRSLMMRELSNHFSIPDMKVLSDEDIRALFLSL